MAVLFVAGTCYAERLETYTNHRFNYTVDYPESWNVMEAASGLVAFKAPKTSHRDDIDENVSVKALNFGPQKPESAEQWRDVETLNLAKIMPQFSLLDNGTTRIGNRQAAFLIYNTSKGRVMLRIKQCLFLVDSVGYVVTYVATEATYDRYSPLAEDIISSIRVR
jgi:hypothetical protein